MSYGKRFGILRFVNYKETSLDGLDRAIQYICNPASSPKEWQQRSFLSEDDPVGDFEAIEERYKRNGGRLYKQCILSFGCIVNDENVQIAARMVKGLMETYRGRFPYIAALHTNVAGRLHAHILMGMTNVKNGSKFSQSPEELKAFKCRYDELAELLGLPKLKRWKQVSKDEAALGLEMPLEADDDPVISVEAEYVPGTPSGFVPVIQPYVNPTQVPGISLPQYSACTVDDALQIITKRFQDDCVYFYELARGRKGGIHDEQ